MINTTERIPIPKALYGSVIFSSGTIAADFRDNGRFRMFEVLGCPEILMQYEKFDVAIPTTCHHEIVKMKRILSMVNVGNGAGPAVMVSKRKTAEALGGNESMNTKRQSLPRQSIDEPELMCIQSTSTEG